VRGVLDERIGGPPGGGFGLGGFANVDPSRVVTEEVAMLLVRGLTTFGNIHTNGRT
jgi:hypothetical protein